MQGVIAAKAVRKEQGSLEPELEDATEIIEGVIRGGAANTPRLKGCKCISWRGGLKRETER